MKRLAIETATAACSVGVDIDGRWLQRSETGPRIHARVLVPWVRQLLAEAGIAFGALDEIAVDRGPGGFTSLRLGLGVAQGIALAHELPTRPVSSLAAVAQEARRPGDGRVLAVLDARMGEVYAGWFDCVGGSARAVADEWLGAADALPLRFDPPFRAVGSGFAVHAEALCARLAIGFETVDAAAVPTAAAVSALAGDVDALPAHALEPVYLRDRVTG